MTRRGPSMREMCEMRESITAAALAMLATASCASAPPRVTLSEDWPANVADYRDVTSSWTRTAVLHGDYQEILSLDAIFKSPEWRAAHAAKDADALSLDGTARQARFSQAQADAQGPYEVELLVTTWDRRENDLDRGKRSVWKVFLVDDHGTEIAPLEIVKDKRPPFVLRAEFPALNDFANAYIARFPRDKEHPVLGPGTHSVKLRMSSERGGVEVAWLAP